jgi:hypothetical protein
MIIEPVPGKYIQYQYHLSADKTISFKCPYIPKIIDYGRSFFDNGNTNSKKVYEKICNTPGCHKCGEGVGFDWLDPNPAFFITSTKKNESHDLRLLNIIHKKIDVIGNKKPTNPTFKQLVSIIKKVKYGIGLNDTDKNYGTEENLTNHPTGDDIYHIGSAFSHLKDAVCDSNVMNENQSQYIDSRREIGVLHIYDDGRPMKYEPHM